jgi:hypothetical protein
MAYGARSARSISWVGPISLAAYQGVRRELERSIVLREVSTPVSEIVSQEPVRGTGDIRRHHRNGFRDAKATRRSDRGLSSMNRYLAVLR